MTDTVPFRPARLAIGALYPLAGHALVVAAAYLAGLIARPSAGGGFEDLAAVAVTGIGGEALLGSACLVVGSIMFRSKDRERGLGLVGGWVAGLAILVGVLSVAR